MADGATPPIPASRDLAAELVDRGDGWHVSPELLTAADCERIFHERLEAGDPQGVHAALTLLAVRDPHRAQTLLDLTRAALHIAKAPAAKCAGVSATWCPVHGDCRCPERDDGMGRTLTDPGCPLHAPTSSHAEAASS
jgi:hypothetical protein